VVGDPFSAPALADSELPMAVDATRRESVR